LLDRQVQAAARIEKLETANFGTPEGLKEHADENRGRDRGKARAKDPGAGHLAAISVVGATLSGRITKIESRLRFF
jgi:hypothetical protein